MEEEEEGQSCPGQEEPLDAEDCGLWPRWGSPETSASRSETGLPRRVRCPGRGLLPRPGTRIPITKPRVRGTDLTP